MSGVRFPFRRFTASLVTPPPRLLRLLSLPLSRPRPHPLTVPSRFDRLLQPASALLGDQHRLGRGNAAAAREAIVQGHFSRLAAPRGSN